MTEENEGSQSPVDGNATTEVDESDMDDAEGPNEPFSFLGKFQWMKDGPFLPQVPVCQTKKTEFSSDMNLTPGTTGLEIFRKFVTDEMINTVLIETNR